MSVKRFLLSSISFTLSRQPSTPKVVISNLLVNKLEAGHTHPGKFLLRFRLYSRSSNHQVTKSQGLDSIKSTTASVDLTKNASLPQLTGTYATSVGFRERGMEFCIQGVAARRRGMNAGPISEDTQNLCCCCTTRISGCLHFNCLVMVTVRILI